MKLQRVLVLVPVAYEGTSSRSVIIESPQSAVMRSSPSDIRTDGEFVHHALF
jgi:hypothetical protein